MKKDSEKQPIDDLFARKLGKMSLPAHPDGFERLQKRMKLNKQEVRMVLWCNQTAQRYMATAAWVALCLLGWIYWYSNAQTTLEEVQVATNKPLPEHSQKSAVNQFDQAKSVTVGDQGKGRQVTFDEKIAATKRKNPSKVQIHNTRKPVPPLPASSPKYSESVLAQVKLETTKVDLEGTHAQNTPQTDHQATEPVVSSLATVKPSVTTERVLIVTIEEPASLLAARQKAQKFVEEKAALTVNDKAEKEAKRNVWQQVKRFKEGELLARHNEEGTDEQGLLDRAYNSLKHSFDKNKPTKQ